ncbi:MAG TPA: nicotinamide-nucleotide amidohydrolase family protein, partial [Clostridiales bacterium]|nr:nicotinamide-nucleotide amidohydrolase family protein [Clostridiales bacterium]
IAPYAKLGEVNFRITASANDKAEAKKLIEPVVNEFKNRFANKIFTTNEEETLEDVVVNLLLKNGLKLSTAESCTGGLLSGKIINVSGASKVFEEGFITYSNKAKEKYLKVNKESLDKYGAVSSQVAKEMVLGTAKKTGSQACIAITGLAGPEGGSKEKPVGLVYIAVFLNNNVEVKEYRFNGNRQSIRERTVVMALDLLRLSIINTL